MMQGSWVSGGTAASILWKWARKWPSSIGSVDFFIFIFLLARFGGLFYFYFFIGQVQWTTARHFHSEYLQMLTEEIQKENNTITDGGVAPRCSFAGPT